MRHSRNFVLALGLASAALLAPAYAQVKDLPRAKPEAVGMSSERLARITATLAADVEAKKLPGAILLVARHGKVVQFDTVGKIDADGSAPMTKDAIFRIYSMTKPITTLTAVMLVEEGKLLLSDPVSKYIPAFAKMQVGVEKADAAGGKPSLELVAARRQITIQDLMRHTSGITYGFFGGGLVKAAYNHTELAKDDASIEVLADRLSKLPLAYQPGTTWDYGYSTDVLGRVVEVVTGKTLYQAMKERILDPLGLVDTSFYVTDRAKHARVVEPFADDRVIGRNAEFGDPRIALKLELGGSGMMSTAVDYARFLQMLLNGGTLEGKRYVSPKTLGFMTSDHLGQSIATTPLYLPGPGYGFGLGFGVRRVSGEAAFPAEAGSYFWGGAGGTYFWVDPKTDMFVVFMMQSPKQREYYRPLLHDMVYAAVMK